MRQIFLDTETTGLSADNGDRVIEIGCVELLNRKLKSRLLLCRKYFLLMCHPPLIFLDRDMQRIMHLMQKSMLLKMFCVSL